MIASKNFTKILIIILILIGICYGFYSYQDLFTNENKVIEIQEMNNIVVSSINPELINPELINSELIKEPSNSPSKKKILIGLLGFIGVVVFIGFLKGPLYLLTPFYSLYISILFSTNSISDFIFTFVSIFDFSSHFSSDFYRGGDYYEPEPEPEPEAIQNLEQNLLQNENEIQPNLEQNENEIQPNPNFEAIQPNPEQNENEIQQNLLQNENEIQPNLEQNENEIQQNLLQNENEIQQNLEPNENEIQPNPNFEEIQNLEANPEQNENLIQQNENPEQIQNFEAIQNENFEQIQNFEAIQQHQNLIQNENEIQNPEAIQNFEPNLLQNENEIQPNFEAIQPNPEQNENPIQQNENSEQIQNFEANPEPFQHFEPNQNLIQQNETPEPFKNFEPIQPNLEPAPKGFVDLVEEVVPKGLLDFTQEIVPLLDGKQNTAILSRNADSTLKIEYLTKSIIDTYLNNRNKIGLTGNLVDPKDIGVFFYNIFTNKTIFFNIDGSIFKNLDIKITSNSFANYLKQYTLQILIDYEKNLTNNIPIIKNQLNYYDNLIKEAPKTNNNNHLLLELKQKKINLLKNFENNVLNCNKIVCMKREMQNNFLQLTVSENHITTVKLRYLTSSDGFLRLKSRFLNTGSLLELKNCGLQTYFIGNTEFKVDFSKCNPNLRVTKNQFLNYLIQNALNVLLKNVEEIETQQQILITKKQITEKLLKSLYSEPLEANSNRISELNNKLKILNDELRGLDRKNDGDILKLNWCKEYLDKLNRKIELSFNESNLKKGISSVVDVFSSICSSIYKKSDDSAIQILSFNELSKVNNFLQHCGKVSNGYIYQVTFPLKKNLPTCHEIGLFRYNFLCNSNIYFEIDFRKFYCKNSILTEEHFINVLTEHANSLMETSNLELTKSKNDIINKLEDTNLAEETKFQLEEKLKNAKTFLERNEKIIQSISNGYQKKEVFRLSRDAIIRKYE